MKMYLGLGLCFFAYLVFGVIIAICTAAVGNLFFGWNVFLAFLPLFFVRTLRKYLTREVKKTGVVVLLAVLWLLFFPNAPYMTTDLIYFGDTTYLVKQGASMGYTTSVLAWAKLIYIAYGVLFGSLLGLMSLYEMHKIILRHKGKLIAGTAVIVTSLLSGFAIYIGRVMRFNSWDVLRPIHMLTRIKEELSTFSIVFSLLFALYIFGSYVLFYALCNKRYGWEQEPVFLGEDDTK